MEDDLSPEYDLTKLKKVPEERRMRLLERFRLAAEKMEKDESYYKDFGSVPVYCCMINGKLGKRPFKKMKINLDEEDNMEKKAVIDVEITPLINIDKYEKKAADKVEELDDDLSRRVAQKVEDKLRKIKKED